MAKVQQTRGHGAAAEAATNLQPVRERLELVQDNGPINVVLVDRQSLYREALSALLNDDHFVVAASVGTISELDSALQAHLADVVVVRLDSLEAGSLGMLEQLPRLGDQVKALVLTAVQDTAVYARAIELGAHGVLSCDEPASALRQAIRAIYSGELWIDRRFTAAVVSNLVKGRAARNREQFKIESLTRREREIVALVTEGLRNKQIAERLFISEATVRNHLTSVLDKLELGDRFDLAVYAFRRGMVSYSLTGEPAQFSESRQRLG
ncbi:MAG: response regulator transcription factor [Vicinamibacterales bacterium]